MALEPRSHPQAEDRRGKEVVAAPTLVVSRVCATVATLAVLASVAGCATTPAEKAQADIATMQRETAPDMLVERGKAFAAAGDSTRAEEYLSAALDHGADPHQVLPLLLDVCVQTGRYRSAALHAENQLRRHPDDVRTRFVLGTLYAALGDTKEAHGELARVVQAKPNEAKAHYALGVLARDNENDVVGADKEFREYLRLDPRGEHAEEARASLLKQVPQPSEAAPAQPVPTEVP